MFLTLSAFHQIYDRVRNEIGPNRTIEIARVKLTRSHEHTDQPSIDRRADIRDDVVADHRNAAGRLA